MIKLAQKYIEDFKRVKRVFWAFQIEPTSRCQLRCVVCPRTCFFKRVGIERYAHFKPHENQQALSKGKVPDQI